MPTRDRSMCGYFAAAALIQRMRSGKPASPRFFQQTSWNALDRQFVPMPSIWTTMNPSSASACCGVDGAKRLGDERVLRPGVDLLDDRVLLRRVEVRRAGRSRRRCRSCRRVPWRRTARGAASRSPAGPTRRPRSSSQTSVPSSARRSSVTGGRSTRDQVSIRHLRSGENCDRVRAVALGEDHQPGAVEIHAAVVDVVRVLPGTDAAGAEPDLPRFLVDAVDAADDPLALA